MFLTNADFEYPPDLKRRKDGRSGSVFSQKGMYLFASVLSAAIYGMEVREIQVEADVSDGLPSFAMVGFPSAQVREAQERVRTAFKNNRLCLPPKKVTVNFAPADMKKEGAGFDLPVAAAVLAAAGILEPDLLEGVMIVGEISLNGEIHGVAGVLPRVIRARELGLRFCVIPEENIREGNLVKDMPVFGVKSLNAMMSERPKHLYSCVSGKRKNRKQTGNTKG